MFGMFNPMSAVTSQLPGGGGGDDEGDKEKEEEAERERQEAIAEAEERRKDKHRKMEEEREGMRQGIRDKYKIKKKEEVVDPMQMEPDNPLMRKKKTPEELEKEAEMADQDELTRPRPSRRSGSPKRMFELKNTLENQVGDIKQQIEDKLRSIHGKCSLQ